MSGAYRKFIIFFSLTTVSASFTMDRDKTFDIESGSDTRISYQSLPQALESTNPINRKRSPWTNFYTVAGGLMGTGITATVTWHLATSHTPDQIDDASPWVYGAGTVVATFGVCCYFATYGANIFHTTYKKMAKRLQSIGNSQGDL